jgi:hypothetical protein
MAEQTSEASPEGSVAASGTESPPAGVKTPLVTKKDLFVTFLIFFLIFTCVGYLRGRSIRNEPDRLRLDVLSSLTFGEKQGGDILAYQCNDNRQVRWDIDRDTRLTEITTGETTEGYAFAPAVLKDDSLITAFITGGGAASVFTVKEVLAYATASPKTLKFTNEGHVKLIVVAALAAVSGYELGYQIALHTNSDCGDSRFAAILNDRQNWMGDGKGWEGFERVYWTKSLNDVRKQENLGPCISADPNVKDAQEKKFNLARARFLAFMDTDVLRLEHNLSSEDFDELNTYGQVLREFNKTCGR